MRGVAVRHVGVRIVVVAALLLSLVAVQPPPPADAALTNVWPADGYGEIYPDDMTTADALFVYVTSTIRGGRVCVVAATGPGSCDAPAWGSPNFIVGIGTIFSLIEGPMLTEGLWRLRTESRDPATGAWTFNAHSDVFRIRACEPDECVRLIGRQQADRFKAASAQATELAGWSCTAFAVKDAVDTATTVKGGVGQLGGRGNTFDSTVWMAGAVGGLFNFSLPSINPTADKAKEILKDLSCAVRQMHKDIAEDPPDPEIYEVEPPSFDDPPELLFPEMTELAQTLDRQAGYGIAARIAYERYQAAVEFEDLAAQRIQATAAGEYATELVREMRTSAVAMRELAVVIEDDPEFGGPIFTSEATRNALAEALARVQAEGLSPAERDQLVALGFTQAQLPGIESQFNLDVAGIDIGATLSDVLLAVADGLEEASEGTDVFARTATAVATADLAPPTAAIVSQFVDRDTYRFSAEASSPDGDPFEITWDFGDGTTATGEEVEHTWTRSGQYTVRLTVTETTPWGSTATDEVTLPIQANSPPMARDDTLTVPLGATRTVDLLANDVDPDGDPLQFVDITEPAGGTLDCTGLGVCTYTADRGLVGTETLTYRVTDGTDTSSANLRVTIVAVSDPPVAGDLTVALPRGTVVDVPLPASDPEPGPEPLTVEVVDAPAVVTVTPLQDRPTVRIGVPSDPGVASDSFTYRVSDGANVSSVATVTVTFVEDNQPPIARDVAVSTPAGQPVPITLDAEDPEGSPLTYFWGFVPGASITGTAPDLLFDPQGLPPGEVTFTYYATDGALNSDTATVTVTILPPAGGPIVDLGPDLTVDEGFVFFSATARDPEGGAIEHLWDFGDGRTATGPTAFERFRPGVYDITLTVTDQLGRSASDTLRLTVRNLPPQLFGPSTSFGPHVAGQRISLSASGNDPGGGPVTYRWDLGDGTILEGEDASASIEHVYTTPGTYLARVIVTDEDGASASGSRELVVQQLTVDIGADQVLPEGTPVDLEADVTPTDAFVQLSWDLGDGTVTTGERVTHRYAGDEPRTVTLTARYGGVEVTEQIEISFTNLPPRLGPAVPLLVEAGAAHTLHAGARDPGDDPVTVSWQLGDGTTAEGQRVAHAWAEPGSYTVRLTAVDDEGAEASAVAVVNVVEAGSLARPPTESRGRDYHLAFDRNYLRDDGERYLMITGEARTTGTVSVPWAGFRAEFSIVPGRVSFVRLPQDTIPPDAPDRQIDVDGRAVIVHARRPVTVYGVNRQQFTSDAFLALPDHLAATRYRAIGYGVSGNLGQLTVSATRPETTVTYLDRFGEPGSSAIDAGDVLRIPAGDATGTLVEADRPVHLASGHECTFVPTNYGFCDHLVEAPWPTAMWGQRFLTVPLATRSGDTVRVVADEDDTEVRLDGALVATLAAGGFHEMILEGAHEITTSGPAMVAQYSHGTAYDGVEGDPFMMLVPPFEQWLDRYTVASADGIRANFLNVVIRDGGHTSLRIDGRAVDPSRFSPIGASGYLGAQVPVSAGEHRVEADRPFAMFVYGFDSFDSYGYPAGLALARVADVGSVALSPSVGQRQVGTDDCPVATVLDRDGQPLEGVRVDLAVSQANATERSGFTGSDGSVPLCYRGTATGASSLIARVGATSALAVRSWIDEEPVGNQPPTASDVSVSTTSGQPVAVTLVGQDPDGDPLTYAIEQGPANGTLGSVDGDQVTYTPDPGFAGTDTFTYRALDGTTSSAPATVTVTVTAPPRVPASVTLAPATASNEIGSEDCTTITVRDGAGEPLAATAVTVTVTGANTAAELLETDGDGTTSFCYVGEAAGQDVVVATAGEVGEQATRTWTAPPHVDPNRPPVAGPKAVEVVSGDTIDIELPISDPDGDPLTVTLVEPPAHGSVTGFAGVEAAGTADAAPAAPTVALGAVGAASLTVRYASVPGYVGPDRFRYRVSDGQAEVIGTVDITVRPRPVDPDRPGACRGRIVPPATFTDVPERNVHRASIDCAVWYGIATGRSPAEYAPRASVSRAQMASFVARLIEAGGGTLPPPRSQGFTDLDRAGVHADRIDQLVAAGVVRGRTATTYAPTMPVSRAQMATFLVAAYEYVQDSSLPDASSRFRDIEGNTHEANIRRAAAAEFALGRTATTYEPGEDVQRDQMASFLTRVLERYADDGNEVRRLR